MPVSKYTVTVNEGEPNFDVDERPIIKITSINSKGQVYLEFSEGLTKRENITMINSTCLELEIIPSDPDKERSQLNFTWLTTSFQPIYMEIQLLFENEL